MIPCALALQISRSYECCYEMLLAHVRGAGIKWLWNFIRTGLLAAASLLASEGDFFATS